MPLERVLARELGRHNECGEGLTASACSRKSHMLVVLKGVSMSERDLALDCSESRGSYSAHDVRSSLKRKKAKRLECENWKLTGHILHLYMGRL